MSPTPYLYWSGYYLGVINYLKKQYGLTVTPDNPAQKFVFIIDEINRGDISKIFGELFFAIDQGYRGGRKGKIITQYANLLNDDDVFKDGFYVPENVYIIGTMNDVDRSVESMDFAIRRRFVWKEITPESRIEMLYDLENGLEDDIAKQAECKMAALNKKISDPAYGLGKAYEIGAAYFLKLRHLNFETLWNLNLAPLLREYQRGTPEGKIEDNLAAFKEAYEKA